MRNQYLTVAVDQMSRWPLAWAIPADLFNSLGVMEFVKKEIIMLFGPPQYILSDNDLKLDCEAVQISHIDSISSGSAHRHTIPKVIV